MTFGSSRTWFFAEKTSIEGATIADRAGVEPGPDEAPAGEHARLGRPHVRQQERSGLPDHRVRPVGSHVQPPDDVRTRGAKSRRHADGLRIVQDHHVAGAEQRRELIGRLAAVTAS